MAIKKQFKGATLRRPGAYSDSQTSPDGGGNSATTGVMLIIGEADAGPSGAEEGIQRYSSAAFNQLKTKYRTGALVDSAKVSLAPSRTPGIGGVDTYLIWKTNTSVRASLALGNSYGTVKALEYGIGGNRVTFKNTLSSEGSISVTGSAPVTDFGGLDTLTISIAQNGGAAVTCTFSTPANLAAVISQFNSAITGVTASASSTSLKLTMNAGSNTHRNGWARSFEITGGSALTRLFLTAELVTADSEIEASVELLQPRDGVTQTDVVGGEIAMQIGRSNTGSCTAATVAISSTAMTLTQTGATPSSYSLTLVDHPLIGNLVDAIGQLTGWTVSVPSNLLLQPSTILDQISATGCFSAAGTMPGRIKRDAFLVSDYFSVSTLTSIESQLEKGLPDTVGRTNLAGGTRGASTSSGFDAGLTAALAEELNGIVIAVSQDSADDITAGLTDAASTYDVETLHTMLDTHLRLRGSIKNRKEAQGAVGYRKPTKAACFAQSAALGSELIQLCMEDVLVVDSSNALTWKQPHVFAAMVMGMRMGSSIGEPLTHKVLAVQGVGHYVNATTGRATGDYNPSVDFDDAISAGVTSSEPAEGGQRLMVDNTCYGADESFVFNRGSVMEAAQYTAKTVRADAEASFVGRKNAVVTAGSIKNRIRSKLVELFKGKVLSPSDDAPQGFRDDETFIVAVTGNTAEVFVEVKPVQGLDFILINFTLGETTQAA